MDDECIVHIPQGGLQGFKSVTEKDRTFYSFLGIPYAKPPVGDLRFKAPQSPDSWNGIRNATKERNECSQYNNLTGLYAGKDDCLFLNIHTPMLPKSDEKPLAVMVFIHGGGFFRGSGSPDSYGPDFLVHRQIVLVTINYRLGPFGFLSLENENIPGNAGLKDQVAALRWVRDNIKHFGGDANNVTIFGNSAGGASVQYHLLSDMSKGLFHKAISQSGSALNHWALQRTPLKNTVRLCESLGFSSEDPDEIYEFLQKTSTTTILEKLVHGFLDTFVPSIENEYPDQEHFITELPLKKLMDGNFHDVPYLIGFNSVEGLLELKDILTGCVSYSEINNEPEFSVPKDIPKENVEEVWGKLKTFYLKDEPLTEETLLNYAILKTDTDFLYGIDKSVRLLSKTAKQPIYYYRFSFEGTNTFMKKWGINLPGACHEDELQFLFKSKNSLFSVEENFSICLVSIRLQIMWTNFAKFGNPIPSIRDIFQDLWNPVTTNELNYFEINGVPTMKCDPETTNMAFLEEIYSENSEN